MINPFTKIENERLYPHRNITICPKIAKAHLQNLIDKKITNIETLCNMTIGQIKNTYLLNINEFEVLYILKELKTKD